MADQIIINKEEKPDSVLVSQNAKGEYSFAVKIYGDYSKPGSTKETVTRIKTTFKMLQKEFPND